LSVGFVGFVALLVCGVLSLAVGDILFSRGPRPPTVEIEREADGSIRSVTIREEA
jgi:hypothetical protein